MIAELGLLGLLEPIVVAFGAVMLYFLTTRAGQCTSAEDKAKRFCEVDDTKNEVNALAWWPDIGAK